MVLRRQDIDQVFGDLGKFLGLEVEVADLRLWGGHGKSSCFRDQD